MSSSKQQAPEKKQKRKNIFFSSVGHVMDICAKYPEIYSIGGFGQLRTLKEKINQIPGCSSCQRSYMLNDFSNQMNAIYNTLTAQDVSRLKEILNTEKISYYTKGPNGSELKYL